MGQIFKINEGNSEVVLTLNLVLATDSQVHHKLSTSHEQVKQVFLMTILGS